MLRNRWQELVMMVLAVAGTGCQCARRSPTVALTPVPGAAGLPFAQATPQAPRAQSPRGASLGSLASVRQPEEVKVYGVNRYVDPADGRVLHERHALYRVEQPPGWVTRQPDHQGEVLLGPVLGLRRAEYRPEPIPGETAQALAQQRRVLQETAASVQGLQEDQRRLNAGVERLAQQSAEAQQKLTTVVTVLNGRLKRLEGEEPAKSEGAPDEAAPTPPSDSGAGSRGPE